MFLEVGNAANDGGAWRETESGSSDSARRNRPLLFLEDRGVCVGESAELGKCSTCGEFGFEMGVKWSIFSMRVWMLVILSRTC